MYICKAQLESAVEFVATNNHYLRKHFETNKFETELPIPTVDEKGLRDFIRKSILRHAQELSTRGQTELDLWMIGGAGWNVQFADEDFLEIMVNPNLCKEPNFVKLWKLL